MRHEYSPLKHQSDVKLACRPRHVEILHRGGHLATTKVHDKGAEPRERSLAGSPKHNITPQISTK